MQSNKKTILKDQASTVIAIFALLSFLVFPFFSFLIFLGFMASYASTGRDYSGINLSILIIAIIAPFIALKTSLPYIGNDKFQYIGYVNNFDAGGFFEVISVHPEIISFGLMYLLSALDNKDVVFFVIFVISVFPLFIACYIFDKRSLPFFILLFFSSSIFLNLYGNLIRQGMALSFFSLVIFDRRRRAKYFWAVLTLFSHIPSIIILGCYFISAGLKKLSIKLLFFLYLLAFLLSYLMPLILSTISFNSDSFVGNKSNLYLEWEGADISSTILTFYVLLLSLFIAEALKLNTNFFLKNEAADRLWRMLIIMSVAFITVVQVPVIFNRYYLYFFTFSLLYLSFFILSIKDASIKILVVFPSVLLLMIMTFYRFYNADWFYMEVPSEFLLDNIIAIYLNLL
jgi:hypothetical protein